MSRAAEAVRALAFLLIAVPMAASPGVALALAGFTETLPAGVFLLQESLALSSLSQRFDDQARQGPLIDPIECHEPGGGLQGTLTPRVRAGYQILINLLQYGLLDNLSLAIAVPVVLRSEVQLDLEWEPGDYQSTLARPYSEQDFWEWAGSMGQPRPGDWQGNEGVLADMVLGARYRFSDQLPALDELGLASALMVFVALPTGTPPDPEEVASAGTTSWDLNSQGELGFHLSVDKLFRESLRARLTMGLDLFYEAFFPQERESPTGSRHPLLLNHRPYVGETYTLDPGDFSGVSLLMDAVLWRGPILSGWLTRGDPTTAEGLPPLLQVRLRFTHTHLAQSDWESGSPLWDWEHEKLWRPGYKNALLGRATLSLLRLGLPLRVFVAYRNQTWLGGKNCRPANVLTMGLQVPAKLW